MKPTRVVYYHDGYGYQLAAASDPAQKFTHLCMAGATHVSMVKVPNTTRLTPVNYPLAKLARGWLRRKNTLGIERTITAEAKAFLKEVVA